MPGELYFFFSCLQVLVDFCECILCLFLFWLCWCSVALCAFVLLIWCVCFLCRRYEEEQGKGYVLFLLFLCIIFTWSCYCCVCSSFFSLHFSTICCLVVFALEAEGGATGKSSCMCSFSVALCAWSFYSFCLVSCFDVDVAVAVFIFVVEITCCFICLFYFCSSGMWRSTETLTGSF